ncbi:MAG TPA: YgaP-like transmembrane domain [Thalassobaculum sp.]
MHASITDYLDSGPELSTGERVLSVAGGLMLAAAGTRPRPNMLLSVLAVAAGSYLAYRGATGYCPLKAALADAATAVDGSSEIAPGVI